MALCLEISSYCATVKVPGTRAISLPDGMTSLLLHKEKPRRRPPESQWLNLGWCLTHPIRQFSHERWSRNTLPSLQWDKCGCPCNGHGNSTNGTTAPFKDLIKKPPLLSMATHKPRSGDAVSTLRHHLLTPKAPSIRQMMRAIDMLRHLICQPQSVSKMSSPE